MPQPHFKSVFAFLLLTCLVPGCQAKKSANGGKSQSSQITSESSLAAISRQVAGADLSVLFIGNSHSGPMPREIGLLYGQLKPDQVLFTRRPPASGFLADHAKMQDTLDLIEAGPWDFIVLQGQKYSQSGKHHYPYDGALKLSELAKKTGARIIMFPEWSRYGVADEYLRIDKIHHEIASQTGAIVAPVGKAWTLAAEAFPDVRFHAADGNHASADGNYLTGCLFYAMVTGESPVDPQADARNRRLAEIAWDLAKNTVSNEPATEKK